MGMNRQDFIRGVDVSSLEEEETCGARYFDQGKEGELLSILKSHGTNSIRLRLWNDPYAENGEPYGAGGNDLATTITLAKRVKAAGMSFLLDIQYSDFWADPGKQVKPKAWRNYDDAALEKAVYEYTVVVMQALKREQVLPDLVQVGNELSNGLLWPNGKTPNYEAIARFVNAGIRGVRTVKKDTPVMIHLDNGGNNRLYREWFDHFMERGEKFEYIGLSYYPFWHGSMESLAANMNDIAVRYDKDLIVAETSMGFTMEDYASYEQLKPEERKGMATKPKLLETVPYPMSPKGQCDFMKDLCATIRKVPDGHGKGFYYWEGGWIPRSGSEWATKAACEYVQDKGPGGNEWANQALFDYEGNILPALQEFPNL